MSNHSEQSVPEKAFLQDIRPSTDDPHEALSANFEFGEVAGDEIVALSTLVGGVTASERARVVALANQIAAPGGYIARLLVDQNNEVIEGQHRLEALRLLGVKNVPITRIINHADGIDIVAVQNAITGLRSDQKHQIIKNSLEMLNDVGSVESVLQEYDLPLRYKNHYLQALRAVAEQKNNQSCSANHIAANNAKIPNTHAGKLESTAVQRWRNNRLPDSPNHGRAITP